ncbi:hypothetical protein [Lentisalinibacter salinarum]|uniref:hypothetical protein n=1 Tax=Lentisalinibacter salinarum TaxID=2992239 RepID=UPI003862EEB0
MTKSPSAATIKKTLDALSEDYAVASGAPFADTDKRRAVTKRYFDELANLTNRPRTEVVALRNRAEGHWNREGMHPTVIAGNVDPEEFRGWFARVLEAGEVTELSR